MLFVLNILIFRIVSGFINKNYYFIYLYFKLISAGYSSHWSRCRHRDRSEVGSGIRRNRLQLQLRVFRRGSAIGHLSQSFGERVQRHLRPHRRSQTRNKSKTAAGRRRNSHRTRNHPERVFNFRKEQKSSGGRMPSQSRKVRQVETVSDRSKRQSGCVRGRTFQSSPPQG